MVDLALIPLAFSAGLVTFFNPCAYAMLPAYVAYHLSRPEAGRAGKAIARGLWAGVAVSLGFIAVFLAAGALVSLAGTQIGPFLPWATIAIGGILIVLGSLWLAGARLSFPVSPPAPLRGGPLSFFIFGVGYAIASAACALPVFLMVVLTAIGSGGLSSGLLIFLVYSLGMVAPMVPLAMAVSASKSFASHRFERMTPYLRKAGAAILIIAGVYLIYFQGTIFLP
ncbi:MAG: sulfite exporter TauE/SafE family protein [Hadesarchaea archaeon]|nr:sulfite exporter TauE/SafE family protein [Hadesarchaea archaeon]